LDSIGHVSNIGPPSEREAALRVCRENTAGLAGAKRDLARALTIVSAASSFAALSPSLTVRAGDFTIN